MYVTAFAIADLVLLIITAGFGSASLRKWAEHRSVGWPIAKISTHVGLQVLSIALWFTFIVSGSLVLAWIAFGVITAAQVFGDLLMFASYRARHPDEPKRGYLTMGGDVLSFRRPLPAFHALIGAVAWFGMLAICITATALAA